jgi:hypothetical protein
MVCDGVGKGCRRDGQSRGLGWTDTQDIGLENYLLCGMIDSTPEVGMWGEWSNLDTTVSVILDPSLNMNECDIHALVVTHKRATRGAAMSS